MREVFKSYVSRSPVPLRLLQELRMEAHLWTVRFRGKVHPGWRRERARLSSLDEVNLHFGCGHRILEGWVNIDGWQRGHADYICDLRQPLPFKDGACRLIFTEHVMEHIDPQFRDAIFGEFHRVLAREGTIRIVVPDCALYAKAYVEDDRAWFQQASPSYETRADALNQIFLNHFHRFIDDFTTMERALRKAGFTKVERSSHQGSSLQELQIDTEEHTREAGNLYVEARK